MAIEETTPLVTPPGHDAVYDRFSRQRKRLIVALVSWAGLLPLFVSGTFLPSIPQIALDLHSTGTVINLAVSLSLFSNAVGSLIWASYSTVYGRRVIYLCSLPTLFIGSLGVAYSTDVKQLLAWRCVQALGASSGLSVGAGAIGDIYRLEERGTAMGIFFAAILLGPSIAPLAGGIAARYSSWRNMQLILAAASVVSFILMLCFLPETSHRRLGVDKDIAPENRKPRTFEWVNPFSSLWLLRSPNLMAVTLVGTFVLLTDYVLLVPIAYTIGTRYNITNEAVLGACFIPAGLGNAIGAPVAGRLSDIVVMRWREKRSGLWVPEDRLRTSMFGALVMVPGSVLFSGLATQFIPGNVGLTLNLVCFFINGFGVDMVLSPSAAYNVDILQSRSADIMAANMGFRALILAGATSIILPSINVIGVAFFDAITAALALLAFGLLWCTIRYGHKMRAWVDVGYSTPSEN